MGNKISSRRVAEKAGVAGVPGTLVSLRTIAEVRIVAAKFGYPIAIKAAHGGGGKGLVVVHREEDSADFEGRNARPTPISRTLRCMSRSTSYTPVTSRRRSSWTRTATGCSSVNAIVRCSDATRS